MDTKDNSQLVILDESIPDYTLISLYVFRPTLKIFLFPLTQPRFTHMGG